MGPHHIAVEHLDPTAALTQLVLQPLRYRRLAGSRKTSQPHREPTRHVSLPSRVRAPSATAVPMLVYTAIGPWPLMSVRLGRCDRRPASRVSVRPSYTCSVESSNSRENKVAQG